MLKQNEAYSGKVFIGASDDLQRAQAVIYGMPMDWTVSFRPGSRFGPARIRESSLVLEEYSHVLERELSEITYYDAGDLILPFGNPERSLRQIATFVSQILRMKKFPLGLGGEHLVTWPVIQEMLQAFPDLVVVHFDAHADLREQYEGEVYSHATPLRKIAEKIGGKRVYQFGIRSMTKEEVQYAKEIGIHFYPFEVLEPLKQCIEELRNCPVYLTLDIDVLDPAFAPGTGTPEPGGIPTKELLEALYLMAKHDIKVVGADVVEVAPAYDPTEQTPIVAAKLVREILLGFVS